MGKLASFEIHFTSPQAVFSAGGLLKGCVKLHLRDSMKMRAVRMTCFGRAFVKWSEVENVGHRGGRQRYETVEHTAEEEYFQFRFNLWPHEPSGITSSSSENQILPAGHHTFPFQLQLPAQLPPSFEGAYGYIRYWTKATIDKPWKFDHHTKRAFTVLSKLDLNDDLGIEEPIRFHGEIRGGCCCLPSRSFSGSLRTNRRGFVPGETISLQSEIDNHTSASCWAEVCLRLYITYLADGKFKQERKVIATVQKDGIPRGKEFLWTDSIRVPSLPPSHLAGCKLIRAQYKLQFSVGSDASCACDDIEFEDEIIIGTLPLSTKKLTGSRPPDVVQQKGQGQVPRRQSKDLSLVPSASGTQLVLDPSIKLEDTLSYEECMLFGKVSIKDNDDTEHTLGELVFTPVYAFFSSRRNSSTSAPGRSSRNGK